MEHLLRNDADVSIRDQQGFNAVHYAALSGHKLTLEMLLDMSTADVLARSSLSPPASALHLAVSELCYIYFSGRSIKKSLGYSLTVQQIKVGVIVVPWSLQVLVGIQFIGGQQSIPL